ncbi:MAG: LPS export ABC transporter permease LptG [Gammaproteobacteria bacterium]|nr:LPS export ABC transporter permease LptG [Gammaproteobacteria bacterium]
MTLLDRYLLRGVVPLVLVCLCALTSLSLFVDFAQQSRMAGQGTYTLIDGLAYAALRMPQFAFDALPAAAIIGTFLALGNFSAHNELTVVRASGVSVLRLSVPVWAAGALFLLLAVFLGESLAPPMHALGKRMRAAALNPTPALTQGESVWMRDGDLILNLRPGGEGEGYASAFLFRLAPGGIGTLGRARAARINEDGKLELGGYEETVIGEEGTRVSYSDLRVTETRLSPDIVELVELRPDLMTIGSLSRYARYLEANQLSGQRFRLEMQSRLATMAAVALMCVLALPLVFTNRRSLGGGARAALGLGIALIWFLANRGVAEAGQLYGLPPWLAGWAPTLLLGLAVILLLARADRLRRRRAPD